MSKQKGLLYDSTMCVGCGECYNACKKQNKLKDTNSDFLKDHLSADTYTVVEQHGDLYARKMCMHCTKPTCASVCPVGAFEKSKEGAVIYDAEKCIGCRYCMQACPHQIPRYEWSSTNPRVRKCIMCHDRVAKGLPSACSEACPTGATKFGDMDELIAEAKQRLKDSPDTYYQHIYGLEEAGGGNVLVLASVPFEKLGYTPNLPKEALPELTGRVMEKIPTIVAAGGVFLGSMHWLTKRKNQIAREKRDEQLKRNEH
ncbi:MAG: 4Fe-4S dicluster domain-containing protein [Bacteroidota bacterium]|jgi:formate dehydrogenase iron-sulfur subunit|nr:4Fe-4S dicluster domain-containing protein [Ignavibacteria bacterium]MCU7499730.1 4Fe-4S dicluster domain-containing protein [Ignavibacteria bacterium]MCU7513376.1 4Fe-4S dicluster domain-containing protein [Ignavibacteria bacterium]MCU7519875.1 4Fe-4S dicluster domain-containing protein [Ignavibacteria bacterium]